MPTEAHRLKISAGGACQVQAVSGPGGRSWSLTSVFVPVTRAQHLVQVAVVSVFVEKQKISSLPSHHSWTLLLGAHVPVSPTLTSIPTGPWQVPATVLLAWVPSARQGRLATGTGLGPPASTCGGLLRPGQAALADKTLISLPSSPEWEPIFMSELGNELHLSSLLSMRKVSRRSG